MSNAPFESDHDAMTIEERQTARMRAGDRQLVDLLSSVLTDPNLHTDTRMRLHEQIAEILRGAGDGLHGAGGDGLHGAGGDRAHAPAPEEHGEPLPDVVASVLVDPNLHTDTRMRLHQEIAEILARVGAPRQV